MTPMAYRSLHEFITALEEAGELVRITHEVSAHLEITEITDRVSKAGGPALLFEHVTGSAYPRSHERDGIVPPHGDGSEL